MQPADPATAPPAAELPAEPWRRRLVHRLLYGRGVDRAAKARARVGLAIAGFTLVYVIIAVRLALFALAADPHGIRRGASQDAVATARPDVLDRNGQILATDVKAVSYTHLTLPTNREV